jgi:hypothetical protein
MKAITNMNRNLFRTQLLFVCLLYISAFHSSEIARRVSKLAFRAPYHARKQFITSGFDLGPFNLP